MFTGLFPLVGIGLAFAAMAHDKTAPPWVDDFLQKTYGHYPMTSRALGALTPERREKWLLAKERDDQRQPAEWFKGAWPYWAAWPTKAITERVLEHVAKWNPKCPWGTPRARYADPLLREYASALRAAGEGDDAAKCEEALATIDAKHGKAGRG
jgi:hypothetical protein